jgi:hypothetical protein
MMITTSDGKTEMNLDSLTFVKRLNSLTKYSSILNTHEIKNNGNKSSFGKQIIPKGRYFVNEKFDGQNVRIIQIHPKALEEIINYFSHFYDYLTFTDELRDRIKYNLKHKEVLTFFGSKEKIIHCLGDIIFDDLSLLIDPFTDEYVKPLFSKKNMFYNTEKYIKVFYYEHISEHTDGITRYLINKKNTLFAYTMFLIDVQMIPVADFINVLEHPEIKLVDYRKSSKNFMPFKDLKEIGNYSSNVCLGCAPTYEYEKSFIDIPESISPEEMLNLYINDYSKSVFFDHYGGLLDTYKDQYGKLNSEGIIFRNVDSENVFVNRYKFKFDLYKEVLERSKK